MSLETAESRLSDLRSRDAADEAWQWILDLKKQAKSNRAAAEAQLNAIFRLGTPPASLHGPTDGVIVMMTTNPVFATAVRLVSEMWMPWQGKWFDSGKSEGGNRVVSAARLPVNLLLPKYKMKDVAEGKLVFGFKTYTEASKCDPDLQVHVNDYSQGNPSFLRSARDELVEVVRGVYLGKILVPRRDRYENICFFALRT